MRTTLTTLGLASLAAALAGCVAEVAPYDSAILPGPTLAKVLCPTGCTPEVLAGISAGAWIELGGGLYGLADPREDLHPGGLPVTIGTGTHGDVDDMSEVAPRVPAAPPPPQLGDTPHVAAGGLPLTAEPAPRRGYGVIDDLLFPDLPRVTEEPTHGEIHGGVMELPRPVRPGVGIAPHVEVGGLEVAAQLPPRRLYGDPDWIEELLDLLDLSGPAQPHGPHGPLVLPVSADPCFGLPDLGPCAEACDPVPPGGAGGACHVITCAEEVRLARCAL